MVTHYKGAASEVDPSKIKIDIPSNDFGGQPGSDGGSGDPKVPDFGVPPPPDFLPPPPK